MPQGTGPGRGCTRQQVRHSRRQAEIETLLRIVCTASLPKEPVWALRSESAGLLSIDRKIMPHGAIGSGVQEHRGAARYIARL